MTPRLRHLAPGLAMLASLGTASAYESGPPDAMCGNPPGQSNCTMCHYEFEVNSGGGSLALLGLPADYVPGQTYALTVQLEDQGQDRWGFELTVLDDADPTHEGGQLAVTDPDNTQISYDYFGTEDYLKQTKTGTQADIVDGPVTWTFDWTAPDATVSSVTFYVAGNAADGDVSYTGDYIYLKKMTLFAAPPTPVDGSSWGKVKALYRGALPR